jgi:hypothetical protein
MRSLQAAKLGALTFHIVACKKSSRSGHVISAYLPRSDRTIRNRDCRVDRGRVQSSRHAGNSINWWDYMHDFLIPRREQSNRFVASFLPPLLFLTTTVPWFDNRHRQNVRPHLTNLTDPMLINPGTSQHPSSTHRQLTPTTSRKWPTTMCTSTSSRKRGQHGTPTCRTTYSPPASCLS